MGLISNLRGIKYRIRIFHDNYHIKTVTVKAKGQRFVTVLVENPLIGHKEKLAFMIPHDIKPFVFRGTQLEFNFDIRDATPLSDLTDLYPDFIHDLNEDLKTLFLPKEQSPKDQYENQIVIDADIIKFDQKKPEEEAKSRLDSIITEITKKKEEPEQAKTETVKKTVESAVQVTKDSTELLKEIVRLHLGDDIQKRDKIKKITNICGRYPKLLYWLPGAMDLDKEVYSLVSAKAIYRTGIMPSYYAAQSGALISEKVLERPKEQPSWITVALVGVIGIIIIAMFLIVLRR
jgi:hypothetical protein